MSLTIGGKLVCISDNTASIYHVCEYVPPTFLFVPNRKVLLVCHKNKWHDLWQKLITSLILFFEGWKENILIGWKYFWNSLFHVIWDVIFGWYYNFGKKIYYFLFQLANWEKKSCFGPIWSLFTFSIEKNLLS